MRDGTFWVSDEYGPFLVRFDSTGRERERVGPCDGGLPPVYRLRQPNLGMEGLTRTPDSQWLVGMMQAPLANPAADGVRGVSRATRILFRHVVTGAMREYLYLLDSADLEGVSEILALTDGRFLVLERDDRFPGARPAATVKRIYEIDVRAATDISSLGALGARPIAGGKTLEQASVAELASAGVVPVTKRLVVDLLALGFPHDKAEGLAHGTDGSLLVSSDDDFGITAAPGGGLEPKRLPLTGARDASSVWQLSWNGSRAD